MSHDILEGKVDRLKQIRSQCLESFAAFCVYFTDSEFYEPTLHNRVCNFLQDGGREKLLVLPRGFLKSTITSQLYALWRAIHNHSIRILIASNTAPNAQKMIAVIRGIFEKNSLFRSLFPDVVPININKIRWSDSCACVRRPKEFQEGTFEAVGIGSNVVSRHYNLIIEDDTIAPKKDEMTGSEVLPTKMDIEQAIGWHKLARPLLINPSSDELIVCGTRWSYFDLINHVGTKEHFHQLNIPAIDNGIPAYPTRFTIPTLDALHNSLGHYFYSALYLNAPVQSEYMVFKAEWLSDYFTELPANGFTIITVDPAISKSSGADYSVIMSCKHCAGDIYVNQYKRERLSPMEIIDTTLEMHSEDNALTIRVEAEAYQEALVYGFKDAISTRNIDVNIEGVKTKGRAKEERIRGLQPLFERGRIHLRANMSELENELLQFPYGQHDDTLDALAWQLHSYIPAEGIPVPNIKTDPLAHYVFPGFSTDSILKNLRTRGMNGLPFKPQLA